MLRTKRDGGRATVLFLTDGENPKSAFFATAGVRRKEAAVAMRIAGADRVSWGFAELGIRTRKAFTEAVRKLERLIRRVGPDEIYVTAYEAGHYDHDIANAMAARADSQGAAVLEYPMYNQDVPVLTAAGRWARRRVLRRPGRHVPPAFIRNSRNRIERLALTDAERAKKGRMLACYASQNPGGILEKTFLFDEKFRRLPAYDYSRLPGGFRVFRLRNRNKEDFYMNITGTNRKTFERAVT